MYAKNMHEYALSREYVSTISPWQRQVFAVALIL